MTKTVLKRFDEQRSRGTTSFGFYLPQKDKMVHNIKEARIKSLLKRTTGDNQEVLFHHRMSTSTPDVRKACHPFSTKEAFDYEYIGVHNGVVQNSHLLKSDHEKLGMKYVSNMEVTQNRYTSTKFNDSEALIYDLARYFEGKVDKLTAYGTIAFIVIRMDSTGKARKLFFGTNRGSLVMKRTKDSMVISSEGKGTPVPDNVLHMYDYDTQQLTTEPMEINRSYPTYRPTPTTSNSSTSTHTPSRIGAGDLDDEELNRRWAGSYPSAPNSEDIARGYLGRSADSTAGGNTRGKLTKAEQEEILREIEESDAADEDNDDVDQDLKEYFGYEGGEFIVLTGRKRDIKKRILGVNANKHHAALLDCRKRLVDTGEELERLNKLKIKSSDSEEFLEYYGLVSDYSTILSEIGEELKAEAQSIEDAKEATADRVMGFHIPERTLAPHEQKLAS